MDNQITIKTAEAISVFGDAAIGQTYSSFSPDSQEGKIKLYNAINSPDHRLGDVINQRIMMRDVVISYVKLAGERTDEKGNELPAMMQTEDKDAFRVVIIDETGASYNATSQGIYNSMCTLRNVFGDLHFDQPLPILVRQIKTKNGNTLSIQIDTK